MLITILTSCFVAVEDAVAADDDSNDEEEEVHTAGEGSEKDILANLQNQKERFYVKDPHKALKHFFDQEGMY